MHALKLFLKFELFVALTLLAMAALAFVGLAFILGHNLDSIAVNFIVALITRFALPYCAPFVFLVSVPAYFLYIMPKMQRIRKWLATFVVIIGCGVAIECYPAVDQCEISHYARNKILSTLTDAEKATLKGYSGLSGSDEFCSTDFVYMKDGKRTEATVVSDMIHGPKIFTSGSGE